MKDAASPSVSVVIPALNEGDNLVDTVRYVLHNSEYDALEVIVVDDGSQDGSVERTLALCGNGQLGAVRGPGRGIAQARNRGAEEANGEVIVFLDAHCYVPSGWLAPLVWALSLERAGLVGPAFSSIRDPTARACGTTWRDARLANTWLPCGEGISTVPFHIGACQAVRADLFRQVGGYDRGMTRWGSEDIELCLRLWLLGYRVYAQPVSLVYHLFRTRRPYKVNRVHIVYNHLRLALLHFDPDRLSRVIRHMLPSRGIEHSLVRVLTDDTLPCRQALMTRREHDLDWFCKRFQIDI